MNEEREVPFAFGDMRACELAKGADHLRREAPSVDSSPISSLIPDYSCSAMRIQRGLSHLDESLPNGQRKRSELAFKLLLQGTEELAVWMRAKGYDV